MVTRSLGVKFGTEGFAEAVNAIKKVGFEFDAALDKARKSVSEAVKASRDASASGDSGAFEAAEAAKVRAAKQSAQVIANAYRELRVKSASDIEQQKIQAISAYRAIQEAAREGVATTRDVINAQRALKDRLAEIEGQARRTGKAGQEGFTVFKAAIAGAAAGLTNFGLNKLSQGISGIFDGIKNAIGYIGKVGIEAENNAIAFTTFLGSAEKAKKVLEDITNFAASTPFELPEVTDTARQLLAFGVEAKNLIPTLKAIGDVAAGVGKPLGQIALVYGQVLSKGKLQGEELLQFAEAGVPIMEELAKVMKVSKEEVSDLASKGKIGFEEMNQVFINLTSQGGKFFNLMGSQSQATGGKISNLSDQFTKLGTAIFDAFKPLTNALVDVLSDMLSPLGQQSDIFAEIRAETERIAKELKGNPQIVRELGQALSTLLAQSLKGVVEAAKQLSKFLKDNPTAIESAIQAMPEFISGLKEALKVVSEIVAGLKDAAVNLNIVRQGGGDTVGVRSSVLQNAGPAGLAEFDRRMQTATGGIPRMAYNAAQMTNPFMWGKESPYAVLERNIAERVIEEATQKQQRSGGFSGVSAGTEVLGDRRTERLMQNLRGVSAGVAPLFPVPGRNANQNLPGPWGMMDASRGGGTRRHNGIDYQYPTGTPLVAPFKGRVSALYSDKGEYGLILEGLNEAGQKVEVELNHLATALVKAGQQIQKGQQIGTVGGDKGSFGSTGAHLDLKVRVAGKPVDPRTFFGKTTTPMAATGQQLMRGNSRSSKASTEEQRFVQEVIAVANRLGVPPLDLLTVMSFETGGTLSAKTQGPNVPGQGSGRGLIQFMPATAQGLGTSDAALAKMSRTEQLRYVEKYFAPHKGKLKDLQSLYSTVFAGRPDAPPTISDGYHTLAGAVARMRREHGPKAAQLLRQAGSTDLADQADFDRDRQEEVRRRVEDARRRTDEATRQKQDLERKKLEQIQQRQLQYQQLQIAEMPQGRTREDLEMGLKYFQAQQQSQRELLEINQALANLERERAQKMADQKAGRDNITGRDISAEINFLKKRKVFLEDNLSVTKELIGAENYRAQQSRANQEELQKLQAQQKQALQQFDLETLKLPEGIARDLRVFDRRQLEILNEAALAIKELNQQITDLKEASKNTATDASVELAKLEQKKAEIEKGVQLAIATVGADRSNTLATQTRELNESFVELQRRITDLKATFADQTPEQQYQQQQEEIKRSHQDLIETLNEEIKKYEQLVAAKVNVEASQQRIAQLRQQVTELTAQETRELDQNTEAYKRNQAVLKSQAAQIMANSEADILSARAGILRGKGDEFGSNALMRQAETTRANAQMNVQVAEYERLKADPSALAQQGLSVEQVDQLITRTRELNTLTLESINQQYKTFGETLMDVGKGALEDFFTSIFEGTKSVGDAFRDMAISILRSIARIAAQQVVLNLFGQGQGGGFAGLFGIKFAEGGLVRGPGTGTSDSIMARLSNGEYVVNATATRALGTRLLDSLNAVRTPQPQVALSAFDWDRGSSRGSPPAGATINMTVVTPNADSFRKSESQIGREQSEQLRRFYERNA